jgi:type II secretory pathway component PulF
VKLLQKIVGWVLQLIGVTVAMGFILTVVPRWMTIWVVLSTILLAWHVMKIRSRSQRVVLMHLDHAVALNQPLGASLRAAASMESRGIARRLTRLAESLESGMSLARALEMELPLLSRRIVRQIGVAERTGTVRRTLAQISVARQDDSAEEFAAQIALLTTEAVFVVGIGLFAWAMRPFVLDTLAQVPVIVELDSRDQRESALIPVVGMVVVVFLAGYVAAAAIFLPWIQRSAKGVARWMGGLWSSVVMRDRVMADAMGAVAASVEGGMGLVHAVEEAAGVDGGVVGRRMRRWAAGMERGVGMAEAAEGAGLGRMVVGVLGMAAESGRLVDGLRFLERHFEGRFHRWLEMVRAAVVPTGVVGLGAFVFWVVLSVVEPVWQMIDAVTGSGGSKGGLGW